MNSLEIGLVSAGCLIGGLGFGLFLGWMLPDHHLNDRSKSSIQIASGMVATITALVLGLLVASAKNSFDTIENANTVTGANFILLARCLDEYGPEAQPIRDDLRVALTSEVNSIWPEENGSLYGQPSLEKSGSLRQALKDLSLLKPTTEEQRALIPQIRSVLFACAQARWLLIEQAESRVPAPLYTIIVIWLTLLFIGFGLFAPRNITVLAALVICAGCASTAIFLCAEMNGPLDGIMKVSSSPMQRAIRHLEKSGE